MADIRKILRDVASGKLSPEAAEEKLRPSLQGFADLGHAKVDVHRRERRGVSEAIYCANKTPQQVLRIAVRLDAHGQNVLCTRVTPEMASEIRASRPDFDYHPDARILLKRNEPAARTRGTVLVLCAGTSDIPVAEEAALSTEMMGSRVDREYDVGVAGIHRLLGSAGKKMQKARVIIVVAGMEGALPSVVAGLVSVPVIGVPTSVGYGASFGGIAALLGMLNSCSGGLAVVNIDNGFGAGFMAHLVNLTGETGVSRRKRPATKRTARK
jgi:NCAIR mutase (PurE)-related protein